MVANLLKGNKTLITVNTYADLRKWATPIEFKDIRQGDLIGRVFDDNSGRIGVAETLQGDKWLEGDGRVVTTAYSGADHYLMRRPSVPLPTTPGDMIRLIEECEGAHKSYPAGTLLMLDDYDSWWTLTADRKTTADYVPTTKLKGADFELVKVVPIDA
ncbi:hypothetical protein [Glutamicibacter creatinolyticus]|uniref:hypothetical protein n=1 Tax=Glutamicibacter creatinolyticus TaxID=162496 RepID=UPI0032172110